MTRAEALKTQRLAILRARLSQGLSQPAAGELLGVSAGTLKNWEQGRRGAPEDVRARIV